MNAPHDWAELPLILHPPHMAQLLDVQVATIWRRCADRRMDPPPYSYQRPYVWYREAVRAAFERGLARAPHGRPARRTRPPVTVAAQTVAVRDVAQALSRALARRVSS